MIIRNGDCELIYQASFSPITQNFIYLFAKFFNIYRSFLFELEMHACAKKGCYYCYTQMQKQQTKLPMQYLQLMQHKL